GGGNTGGINTVGTGGTDMAGSMTGGGSPVGTGATGGTGGAGALAGGAGGGVDGGQKDAAVRDVYVADRPPGALGMLVHVVNGCSFELWVHAAGKEGVLMPDDTHLAPGAAQDYI